MLFCFAFQWKTNLHVTFQFNNYQGVSLSQNCGLDDVFLQNTSYVINIGNCFVSRIRIRVNTHNIILKLITLFFLRRFSYLLLSLETKRLLTPMLWSEFELAVQMHESFVFMFSSYLLFWKMTLEVLFKYAVQT